MLSSHACSITDGDKVVLTGGFGYKKKVAVYDMSGFVQSLPDLHIGRQYHACACYKNDLNQKVEIFLKCVLILMIYILDIFSDGWLHRHPKHKIHGDSQSWSNSLGYCGPTS